jgi:hypothetical protein
LGHQLPCLGQIPNFGTQIPIFGTKVPRKPDFLIKNRGLSPVGASATLFGTNSQLWTKVPTLGLKSLFLGQKSHDSPVGASATLFGTNSQLWTKVPTLGLKSLFFKLLFNNRAGFLTKIKLLFNNRAGFLSNPDAIF